LQRTFTFSIKEISLNFYAFIGAGFKTPIQTFLPCNAFTKNITPTSIKKNDQ
jgi:hypothetical protein